MRGETLELAAGGKKISVYPCAVANAPVVYVNMYEENGPALLAECQRQGCAAFHLVTLSGLRWEAELSPWPHGPMITKRDGFTGEAEGHLAFLTGTVLPLAEEKTGAPSFRVLAGYSMGGLFALYALHQTAAFSRAVAASGSVWYPGFSEYVAEHRLCPKPDALYLSLGDLESRTRNPYLCQAEKCMEELRASYQQQSINTLFELNPGNHHRDATLRLARGIVWTLAQKS